MCKNKELYYNKIDTLIDDRVIFIIFVDTLCTIFLATEVKYRQ